MRKFLIIAAIAAMTFASADSAEAGRRYRGNRGYTQSRTIWQQPSRGGGFFARLMELERRKNAMIFGR